MAVKQQREQQHTKSRFDIRNRTTVTSLFRNVRGGAERGKKHVCLVWRCWYCAVMFPENRSRFTYCIFTNSGRKTFAAAVPPLSTQIISSHPLIHFLFRGGKQLSTSGSSSWFSKLKRPFVGGVAWSFHPFCSILERLALMLP